MHAALKFRQAPATLDRMELELTQQEYLERAEPALIQLNRHLVGVFRRDVHGRVTTVGSGFLVKLAGEHYVATAGHNLEEDPFGVTIWWFQPGSLAESLEGAELLAACEPDPRISYLVDGELDLGLILLRNPKQLLDAGKSFYQVDHLKEKQPVPENTLYFLLGFPARYAKTIQIRRTPGGVYLPESAPMTQMESIPIPFFDGLAQAQEEWFEMKAECKDPDPTEEQTLHYGGYSGGPVFRLVSAQGLDGDPAGFELFGLEFSQRAFRHYAMLKCHYIQRWCSFAESHQSNASRGGLINGKR